MLRKLFALFLAFSLTSSFADTVTAIVPSSPGGGIDITARHFAKFMKEKKNVDMVSIYKPGADSLIGAQFLFTSPTNGSVVGFTAVAGLAAVGKYNNLSFDYISAVRKYPDIVVASTASGLTSFADLQKKIKQGKVYSFGVGSTAHKVSVSQFMSFTGTDSQIVVPYKGASPIVTDLLGGHINVAILPVTLVKEHLQAGKMVALASTEKLSDFPKLPIMSDIYPGWVAVNGYAMVLPKNSTPEALAYWRGAMSSYLGDATVLNDFAEDEASPYTNGPVALHKLVETIKPLLPPIEK